VSAGGKSDLSGHTANLLGALALSVTDRTFDVAAAEPGLANTDAIALSALRNFLDRPTIDLLRRVLGLTSSGAVRLVNRLERAGLVERGDAEDGRATSVVLTAEGRRVAKRVSAARTAMLEHALSGLSAAELRAFEATVSRTLVGLMRGSGATRWMCRFCDMEACGWAEGRCPVREASRTRT
jgi:DNA-binding MarR family transcriptional regulator